MSKPYISTVEHAKSIRSDIKAAVKSGALPAGIKVTVRCDSFSGGSSIRVAVVALPETFVLMNVEQVEFKIDHPKAQYWDMPGNLREKYSAEGRALKATLDAIVDTYHEDNSTDDGGDRCWNVNFYKHVEIDSDVENACRERTEARIVAERAAAAAPTVAAVKPRIYLRAVSSPVEG